MRRLGLFFLCAVVGFCGQTTSKSRRPSRAKTPAKAEAPANSPASVLRAVDIKGLQVYSRDQVLHAAGLEIGKPVSSPQSFEMAQKRLLDSGAFSSVAYEYKPLPAGGWQLTLDLTEVEQVFPYRFEELGVPDEELGAYLRKRDPLFGPQIAGTETYLARISNEIQDFLKQKGQPEKVAGKVVADKPDDLFILFRPDRPYPRVAEVHFLDTKVFPPEILQRRFFNVGVGSAFTEPRFRELLRANIIPMYEAKGRLGVKFTDIQAEPSPDVNGLIVNVKVDEGEVYELNSVRLTGQGIPEDELMELGKFKTEETVDFDAIKAGMERMREQLRQSGYLKNTATISRKTDEKKKTVDVVIHMDLGPQYKFRTLRLKGLDIVGEAAIKKIWTMKPGEPFRAGYPDFFLYQVQARNMFDGLQETKAVTDVDDANLAVDVTLLFNPKKK